MTVSVMLGHHGAPLGNCATHIHTPDGNSTVSVSRKTTAARDAVLVVTRDHSPATVLIKRTTEGTLRGGVRFARVCPHDDVVHCSRNSSKLSDEVVVSKRVEHLASAT